MWAKLISRTLINRPDWVIVKDDVPLGKLYQIVEVPKGSGKIFRIAELCHPDTGELIDVEILTLVDSFGQIHYMPVGLFEIIKDKSRTVN